MTYASAVEFLDRLVNYEKQAKPRDRFKLDNIRRLLALAGNPERMLRNVILIAGTKGKGSVCYLLDAALRGCGCSTGMFVSPHVLDVRERIQLGGEPIAKRTFAALVEWFRPLVEQQPVSYFELTAAMAFRLFATRKPDYSIVEVGLGGRLDATNLCDPKVSVITRIGYDHLKVLGNTLTKIAGEKAGIMREDRPVVLGEQAPEALAALRRKARAVVARLVMASSVLSVRAVRPAITGTRFSVRSGLGVGDLRLPLLGAHQVENCRTALAVLGELARDDCRIKLNRVAQGLRSVTIPARCQVILPTPHAPRPLPFIIVDSCHNPESGRALANVLRDHLPLLRSVPRPSPLVPRPSPKVVLVYGSLSGKLVAKTVAPLAPFVHRAILVRPDSPRAMPLAELSRVFRRLHIPFVTAGSVPAALRLAQAQAQAQAQMRPLQTATCKLQTPPFPVVVAGSFYLAGEALGVLRPADSARNG